MKNNKTKELLVNARTSLLKYEDKLKNNPNNVFYRGLVLQYKYLIEKYKKNQIDNINQKRI